MAFDTSDRNYRDLLARILQSEAQVVPFVGAGLSLYGNPEERLPLWRELLDRLIDEGKSLGLIPEEGDPRIEEALRSRRYVQATDLVLEALGEPTFRRVVERELDESGKPTSPALAEMVAVGWSLIVTTNLDRMIARAYLERYGRPMSLVTGEDTHKLAAAVAGSLAGSETVLAQIHGDIGSYASWRLTHSHYQQLLQDPGYVEALKHLFLRQVFFVGFGLQDDDFDFLVETIARIYPAGVGEFFALIERSRKEDAVIQKLIRQNGLRPIYYDIDPEESRESPFGGHRAVYECLEHLATTWATARTGLDLQLKYFPELDRDIVGRDDEIARLSGLVERGGVAQVVGLGGQGKTSLVQKFLADQRPDLATAGYRRVFGCSFYRADIGQFINDMVVTFSPSLAASLPQQVREICEHVRRNRTILVLDGLEAILDEESKVRNPYLSQIVESVVQGSGSVLVTSRIPVRGKLFERAPVVDIEPLSSDQILEFLRRWGLDRLGDAANRRLVEITAGHPLALRILAGVLRDVPAVDAIATIERSSVIDVSDEVDPLRENRLARILGSYFHHLNAESIAFLECLTAFFGPASYPMAEAALTRDYPDTELNRPLRGQDLRRVVGDLIERRLLIVSTSGDLSTHPTVREYFARQAHENQASLVPIHRFLAAEDLRGAADTPDTFEEAAPLIDACWHAAICEDWSLLDDLFHRRLMRNFREYLCENLGAWEEALGLARLGEGKFPAAETGYYPITVARCLKHLGRSAESRSKYLDSLRAVAPTKDSDTAIYVNNFLTLLAWRGELEAADHLTELNIRALSWIKESWRHRWQVEHGFSSIAYLKMLQGRFDIASALFNYSQQAWDDYPEKRLWFSDYYPFYSSELVLLLDPNAHEESLDRIDSLLNVATEYVWPESICRGHIQAAMIYLDRATRSSDPADLVLANQELERAGATTSGMNVADVVISYHLTRLKAQLAQREIYAGVRLDTQELTRLIDRIAVLVDSSGLALAMPEVQAARGVLALLEGAPETARACHDEAVQECLRQGNALFPRSPRSLVHWLGQRFNEVAAPTPTGSTTDLVSLVGSELSPDWMIGRLEGLAEADQSRSMAL
jgi:tetratricopeptide (TPR) repeat protein